MRTKVSGLTPFNVRELAKIGGWTVARTHATYDGDARAAGKSIEDVMREVISAKGGKATEYTSLIAVRNKLRLAVRDGHPKVQEQRTTEDPDPRPVRTTLHSLTGAQRRALRSWVVSGSTATFLGTPQEALAKITAAADRLAPGHPERRPLQTLRKVLAEYCQNGSHPRVTSGARDDAPTAEPRAELAAALAEPLAPSNVVPIRPAGTVARPVPSSIRNVRVRDDLWADCRTIAEARGETVSAVLVAALNAYRRDHAAEIGPSGRIAGEQELF